MKKSILFSLLVLTTLFFPTDLLAQKWGIPSPDGWWQNGYYEQNIVITPSATERTIQAKVDGVWKSFSLAPFPKVMLDWNIQRRLSALDDISNHQPPQLSGPHNGIVATYGFLREDTNSPLNNAVKGMGFLPKASKIKEILQLLATTKTRPFPEKLQVLKTLYQNLNEIFDLDRQVSLELYSQNDFVTQTFLNQATNPISTVVYLDIPSYKFKSIVRLLDPHNPKLTDYEKDVARYVNDMHSYFHGEFTKQFIAVVYYSVEVYDNSPGRPEAKGKRIVPEWP